MPDPAACVTRKKKSLRMSRFPLGSSRSPSPEQTEGASPVLLERRFHFAAASPGRPRMRLELARPARHFATRVTPLRLLLLSLALGLLAGCEIFPSSDRQEWFPPRFYRVQETNYRGQLIADWIANGYVRRTEYGYRFRAIERTTSERYPSTSGIRKGAWSISAARTSSSLAAPSRSGTTSGAARGDASRWTL